HPMMPAAGQTRPNQPGSGQPGPKSQNPKSSFQAGDASHSGDGTFLHAFCLDGSRPRLFTIPAADPRHTPGCRDPRVSKLGVLPADAAVAKPLPGSREERPPVIRRADVVVFALVALLVICVMAVLYVAKAFFLP